MKYRGIDKQDFDRHLVQSEINNDPSGHLALPYLLKYRLQGAHADLANGKLHNAPRSHLKDLGCLATIAHGTPDYFVHTCDHSGRERVADGKRAAFGHADADQGAPEAEHGN